MIFSEQLSKLRKEANMTQEELAEECDVSRQAVAKWEKGTSIPDLYKLLQIANLLEVSLEELVLGDQSRDMKYEYAKKIYFLFAQNMEDLRNRLYRSYSPTNMPVAAQLKAEIKKSRLVYPSKIVDQLMELADDFGTPSTTILYREEYEKYFKESPKDRTYTYCEQIIPKKYEELENLLGEYLNFPA